MTSSIAVIHRNVKSILTHQWSKNHAKHLFIVQQTLYNNFEKIEQLLAQIYARTENELALELMYVSDNNKSLLLTLCKSNSLIYFTLCIMLFFPNQ